jgi:acetoin utilization protein AcuC
MSRPRQNNPVTVLAGDAIARYGFGDGHPFGPDRQAAFLSGLDERGLPGKVRLEAPKDASRADVELFHSPHHVEFVEQMSRAGEGFLDFGDTPALPGIFDAAMSVVGTTLRAGEMVMSGRCRRAFVPIAGLHHAARVRTSGFCVFNDCAVLIAALRKRHGIRRIAYVDIDAHHGDGVFYGFAEDPDVLVADIHEDGRFLFPGAGDEEFRAAWSEIETYLTEAHPEFIILQCGADSIAGDPITHLQFSEDAHGAAAASLCEIADRFSDGRLVALGGGGYNRRNIATGWSRVVQEMVENT